MSSNEHDLKLLGFRDKWNGIRKIIYIVILILGLDMTTSVYEYYRDIYQPKIDRLEEQVRILNEQNQMYIAHEQEYKDTIKKIAQNIRRTDSYLNIGGAVDADNTENYAKILAGESDFDVYLQDAQNYFDERTQYLNQLPSIWPVFQSEYNRITSPFGDRLDPLTGTVQWHGGIDIASSWRAKIIATADGYVQDHWIFHPEFGRMVIINHGNGFTTVYAHMAKVYVHEGEKIKRGQVIGLMGNSGSASVGAHLHYEIRKDGKALDPVNFLRRAKEEEKTKVAEN